MHRRLAVLVLLALVPAGARAADPVRFCGVEAPPLVYVTGTAQAATFSPVITTRSLYVLQGGFTVVAISRRLPGDNLPLGSSVTSGQGDPVFYRSLVEAMGAVRVGFQEDCYALPLDTDLNEQQDRVTWFGRGRRQNTFLVTNLQPGLPPCPPSMDILINAIDQYVLTLRDKQTLPAPPALPAV